LQNLIEKIDSLPRMRGDPPLRRSVIQRLSESTPHARGSTLIEATLERLKAVYPACAGIHPRKQTRKG